jgi:hypothetical protein
MTVAGPYVITPDKNEPVRFDGGLVSERELEKLEKAKT